MKILFDAHAHIHFPAYNKDREEVIKRAQEAGVKMIAVGTNLNTSKSAIAIAEKYPDDVWATVGIHPTELGITNKELGELRKLAVHPKVVAIGECGLDYYRITNNELRVKETQADIFLRQAQLAQELNKPLMIHCRSSKGTDDAYLDLISIIPNSKFLIPKIAHFFNGSLAIAKKLFDAGFYFTFGGVITFTRDYDEVIKFLPIEKIMLETDAPYVAPTPYRGQRNEPAYVWEVAKKMAEIKNMTLEEVAGKTASNTQRIFSLTK